MTRDQPLTTVLIQVYRSRPREISPENSPKEKLCHIHPLFVFSRKHKLHSVMSRRIPAVFA